MGGVKGDGTNCGEGDLYWLRGGPDYDDEGEEEEGGVVFRYSGGGGFEDVSSSSGFCGESGAVFAG